MTIAEFCKIFYQNKLEKLVCCFTCVVMEPNASSKLDLKIIHKYIIITEMVNYSCERCGKPFTQKSHYDSHKRRKKP